MLAWSILQSKALNMCKLVTDMMVVAILQWCSDSRSFSNKSRKASHGLLDVIINLMQRQGREK
jgi:hypothetical protein